jgi:hypothetical protein
MDQKRPTIALTLENEAVEAERDTLPPSGGRPLQFIDKDETVGLITLLHHAQQATLEASRHIDAARDANDEELASFLEGSLRLDLRRIAQAKKLLLKRLHEEVEAEGPSSSDATHGRLHYVSIPDSPLSRFNLEE